MSRGAQSGCQKANSSWQKKNGKHAACQICGRNSKSSSRKQCHSRAHLDIFHGPDHGCFNTSSDTTCRHGKERIAFFGQLIILAIIILRHDDKELLLMMMMMIIRVIIARFLACNEQEIVMLQNAWRFERECYLLLP